MDLWQQIWAAFQDIQLWSALLILVAGLYAGVRSWLAIVVSEGTDEGG